MVVTEMTDIHLWTGKLLDQLKQDCEATEVWDGIIRVGAPATEKERTLMAKFSPRPEVQEQLALQFRTTLSLLTKNKNQDENFKRKVASCYMI